jgi:hypothetical protein
VLNGIFLVRGRAGKGTVEMVDVPREFAIPKLALSFDAAHAFIDNALLQAAN